MLNQRKPRTVTGYLIRFNEKPVNGNVQSRTAIDTSVFDAMIEQGEILSYDVDNVGVKITTFKK